MRLPGRSRRKRGGTRSENARALALVNMAASDSLVASFLNKYHYNFWRPETAIRAGDTDGNPKTEADSAFLPFIPTPCFPSYPSNHASETNGGTEVLRRLYGEGGHSITLTNPPCPPSFCSTPRFSRLTTMSTTRASMAAYIFELTRTRERAWDGQSAPQSTSTTCVPCTMTSEINSTTTRRSCQAIQ